MLTLAGASLALSACATSQFPRNIPPPGFSGPRFAGKTFLSFDGAALPLETWLPPGGIAQKVLIALHGMNDYAHAFSDDGPVFARAGIACYAYDQRGFGRAPGRGLWAGEALLKADLKAAVLAARRCHPDTEIIILGHSMGGAVAINAFADDDPPLAERLILAAPAVWGWESQPLVNRVALWLGSHLAPNAVLNPPTWLAERHYASDNIAKLREMGRDPLMLFETRIDAVRGLVDLMQRASERMAKIKAPMLYLYGAHDTFVPKEAVARAITGLKPTDRSAYYAKGWHLLMRDLQGETVRQDIIAYIADRAAALPSGAPSLVGTLG